MRGLLIAAAAVAVSLPGAAAAEPIELFNNRLFIPVTVNGTPTIALLDSAAEMTILDDGFARRLGLAAVGSAVAHGSGESTMEARFAEQVAIEATGLRLEQTVAILDLGEVSQRLVGRDVDLVFGRELFDHARLRLDIGAGTIERLTDDTPPRGERLAVGVHRGIPTVPVSIEGQPPAAAVFDVGNGSDVLIGRAYAERLGLTAPERIVERRQGGGLGGGLEQDIVVLRSLSVAGREFHDVRAAIDPGESASDLNIGTKILRHFIITTDFAQGAVWLEPKQ